MAKKNSSKNKTIMNCLNKIYEAEMSGVMRYLHYSFMIMGHNRIPIQSWLRGQANESVTHAITIGEKITSYGGHPPVTAAKIQETHIHSINQILTESLKCEEEGLNHYKELAKLAVKEKDIALEELARSFIQTETEHLDEVRKMLRDSK